VRRQWVRAPLAGNGAGRLSATLIGDEARLVLVVGGERPLTRYVRGGIQQEGAVNKRIIMTSFSRLHRIVPPNFDPNEPEIREMWPTGRPALLASQACLMEIELAPNRRGPFLL